MSLPFSEIICRDQPTNQQTGRHEDSLRSYTFENLFTYLLTNLLSMEEKVLVFKGNFVWLYIHIHMSFYYGRFFLARLKTVRL